MQGHKHANLMVKAAKIAETDAEWWRHFEVLARGTTPNWRQLNQESAFHLDDIYRFAPQPGIIGIGDYSVPEPEREPLNEGQEYWVADVTGRDDSLKWAGNSRDYLWLRCGIIHLTKEAAETHTAALLSFTEID